MTSLILGTPTSLPILRKPEYDPTIRRFNEFLAGRSANEETIREFFELEASLYSAKSIMLHKSAIKAAAKQAYPTHDIRIIATMDALFKSIKLPKPQDRVQEKDLFSKEEIRKIVAHSPKHIGLFIKSLYNTCSRVSECLSMRLDDCFEDEQAIRCPIVGKGKKERTLVMGKALFHTVCKHFGGRTWLFEHHGKRYSRQHMWETIRRYGREATGRWIHPHSMRHSRITHLLEDGVPLVAVSRLAGHSQTSTTTQFYAHNQMKAAEIIRTGI